MTRDVYALSQLEITDPEGVQQVAYLKQAVTELVPKWDQGNTILKVSSNSYKLNNTVIGCLFNF